MSPEEVWQAAKSQLQMQLDRASYETWVKQAEFVRFEAADGLFVMSAPNTYVCDMLNTRLNTKIERMLSHITNQPVRALFEVARKVEPSAASLAADDMPLLKLASPALEPTFDAPSIEELVRAPRLPDLPNGDLNERYTFERFVVSPHNQMVYQAARAVAESPGLLYNPFLIHGGVGVGKTHLLQAIGHEARRRGKLVLYVSSEVFVSEFVSAIRNGQSAMFRQRYRSVDVLLIDDVQFFMGKESTQDEFFHTYNALLQWNKQVVMVSDRHPRDLNNIDERLRSRFQGGLVLDIQAPELETRRCIVDMWSEERGVQLPTDVIEAIIAAPVSVRELEGLFMQLCARASIGTLRREHIDSLTRRYNQPRDRLTLERIIEVTAQKSGLLVEDLLGKKRSEPISQARQIAMYLCRELTGYSLPQIGDAFQRNHSTVVHACNKVIADMNDDPMFRARIEKIRKALGR